MVEQVAGKADEFKSCPKNSNLPVGPVPVAIGLGIRVVVMTKESSDFVEEGVVEVEVPVSFSGADAVEWGALREAKAVVEGGTPQSGGSGHERQLGVLPSARQNALGVSILRVEDLSDLGRCSQQCDELCTEKVGIGRYCAQNERVHDVY
jgi:hypothetical protein